jgi:L-lactate dehydrogenase
VIITAGANQKPGETRLDLVHKNVAIYKSIIPEISKRCFQGILLVVSNPVDILTYVAMKLSRLPENHVIGSGTVLDTARLKYQTGELLGVDSRSVHAFIIGEHGDSEIAAWSSANISGIPIDEYCDEMGIVWNASVQKSLFESTKTMGAEIISAKGRTHYGIATCVCYLADSILNQRPTIVSVCSPMPFETDVPEYALSVPSLVGPTGVQQRVRDQWMEDEYQQFVLARQKMIEVIKSLRA